MMGELLLTNHVKHLVRYVHCSKCIWMSGILLFMWVHFTGKFPSLLSEHGQIVMGESRSSMLEHIVQIIACRSPFLAVSLHWQRLKFIF